MKKLNYSPGRTENEAWRFVAPALLVTLAVILIPFLYNIIISFSDMNLSTFYRWKMLGFTNYFDIFSDSFFWYLLLKTLLWTSINLVILVTAGILLAVLLNEKLPGSAFFKILFILPWAVPQYLTALVWKGIFNYETGPVNLFLGKLGIEPVMWLGSEWGAFWATLVTNVWLGLPFFIVVVLAGLQTIPRNLYEAAELDGAGFWFLFRKVTLPLLKPVLVPAIMLSGIWTFNNLNVIWLVTDGGYPSDQTHILVSWVYKAGLSYFRIGYAAAYGIIIMLVLLFFSWQYIYKSKTLENVFE
ncbi:MAG: sugar ABC transporter permease [Bacteroidetes bacterium]|nr:sugar ABC transporter permease [Bacteroidota bacterium]